MHRPTRLKMTDLNPHFTCVLCDGYFVDATTIVECLHSFCRACIVKYLESNKFCPVCDVQVHKTKPLLSIKSDKTLQDVVYKLVPGLYQNEMKRRREFYADHPEEAARCTSEERGEGANQRFIYTPDETISLSLEYRSTRSEEEISAEDKPEQDAEMEVPPKRYLQCPAAITVGHLKKFITVKYDLPSSYKVEILYSGDVLNENYTLMDIAYIYAWRRSGPMNFSYRIVTYFPKRRKLSHSTRNVDSEKKLPVVDVNMSDRPAEVEKKNQPELPALSFVSSPSSKPELKIVLRARKEEKPHEKGEKSPNTPRDKKEMPALSSNVPLQSSTSHADIKHHEPNPKITMTISAGCVRQSSEKSAEQNCGPPSTACYEIVDNTLSSNRLSVHCKTASVPTGPVGCMVQPAVCTSYCPSVVPKSNVSKRSTRSRVKNRSINRPLLAKLAPYPTQAGSPVTTALTNPPVNHFTTSSVTCFAAPPATCLSTQPVNCLGSVSVNYLPSPSVTCFTSPAASGRSSINTNHLVAGAINSVQTPVSLPLMPVTKSVTHHTPLTTFAAPETSRSVNQCAQIYVNGNSTPVSTTVTTSAPQSFCATNPCVVPVTSTTSSVSSKERAETSSIKQCSVNMAVGSEVAKSVAESKQLTFMTTTTDNMGGGVVAISTAAPSTCSVVSVNSLPVPAPSMPVIPVKNPLVKDSMNSTVMSVSSTVTPASSMKSSKASTDVSFSVSSLVPNLVNSQKQAGPIEIPITESAAVLPKSQKKQPDSIGSCGKSEMPTNVEMSNESEKTASSDTCASPNKLIETTSPVPPEKNSINVPFKEVKSSITAEFSDNDDLGCQPDLVVDEQKLDSSDNEEDEADDALRRKITAIAEKDDEVDDTETDSGRASDISNQARSSCDDDIGSPMPATNANPDGERNALQAGGLANCIPQSFNPPTSTTVVNSVSSPIPSPASPAIQSKAEEGQTPSKPNGIDHIISNLHKNHERKDNIGALDLSTSSRKPGQEDGPRPRPRQVANPPVLDAKHRQQTCLPAPTKQHTACVPVPKHPTSSTFHIGALSASARHSMLAAAQPHLSKLSPVTIPHYSATPIINSLPLKSSPPTNARFCRTPPTHIPVHTPNSNVNSFQGKPCLGPNSRQSKATSATSQLAVSTPVNSYHKKTPSANNPSSVSSPRNDSVSPRHSLSPSTTPSAASPHHRSSPCVTPPKANTPSPSSTPHMLPPVPSTSSYKISRPPIPIYKKSDSYKSSHHHRFKNSNLTVINPDPNGYPQKIVIKNIDPRPNNHNHHHRL